MNRRTFTKTAITSAAASIATYFSRYAKGDDNIKLTVQSEDDVPLYLQELFYELPQSEPVKPVEIPLTLTANTRDIVSYEILAKRPTRFIDGDYVSVVPYTVNGNFIERQRIIEQDALYLLLAAGVDNHQIIYDGESDGNTFTRRLQALISVVMHRNRTTPSTFFIDEDIDYVELGGGLDNLPKVRIVKYPFRKMGAYSYLNTLGIDDLGGKLVIAVDENQGAFLKPTWTAQDNKQDIGLLITTNDVVRLGRV